MGPPLWLVEGHDTAMLCSDFAVWLEESWGTPVVALIVGGLCRSLCYHHVAARLDAFFATGLFERRSKSGHCTSLTTFSAIDPKTSGCQPEMPWVEMMTMSITSGMMVLDDALHLLGARLACRVD
jgi:hypothetical protein